MIRPSFFLCGALIAAFVLSRPAAGQTAEQSPVPGTPPHAAATAAAADLGELYDNVLRDAWERDTNAIAFLLSYTGTPAFRARAVARQHASVMAALLSRVGDTLFAAALGKQYPHVAVRVLAAIDTVAPRVLTQKAYPRTSTFRHRPPREQLRSTLPDRAISRTLRVRCLRRRPPQVNWALVGHTLQCRSGSLCAA